MKLCEICYDSINEIEYDSHIVYCLELQFSLNEPHVISKYASAILTDKQQRAVDYSLKKSKIWQKNTYGDVLIKFSKKGYGENIMIKAIDYIKNIDVIIHFNALLVFEFLLNDGVYKNLFEIGRGNDVRADWEKMLFGGIYNDSRPEEKVKYGSLNITNNKEGSTAGRYGSSYMVIRKGMKKNISFIQGDSSAKELLLATFEYPVCLLNVVNDILFTHIIDISSGKKESALNNYGPYVEAQIHGPVRMAEDIERIVIGDDKFPLNKMIEFEKKYKIPVNYL